MLRWSFKLHNDNWILQRHGPNGAGQAHAKTLVCHYFMKRTIPQIRPFVGFNTHEQCASRNNRESTYTHTHTYRWLRERRNLCQHCSSGSQPNHDNRCDTAETNASCSPVSATFSHFILGCIHPIAFSDCQRLWLRSASLLSVGATVRVDNIRGVLCEQCLQVCGRSLKIMRFRSHRKQMDLFAHSFDGSWHWRCAWAAQHYIGVTSAPHYVFIVRTFPWRESLP